VAGQGGQPLSPSRVEVAVEAGHDGQHVEVGGQDTLAAWGLLGPLRDGPGQESPPGQHGVDDGLLIVEDLDDDPVTHQGEVVFPGTVLKPPRDLGRPAPESRLHEVDRTLAADHAASGEVGDPRTGRKGLGEAVGPEGIPAP